jgi:hypothetical protein
MENNDESAVDVAIDIATATGGDQFIVCCMGCGASSPPLLTDVGLNMWVAVHPCGVPIDKRTWFLTPLGEEVRD